MPKISEISKGKLLSNISLQFMLPPAQGVNWEIATAIALDSTINEDIQNRDELQETYAEIIEIIQPPVEKISGLPASNPSEAIICDRHEWIVRTTDSISELFRDIVYNLWRLLEKKGANDFVKKSSSALVTTELGLLLSFLSTKVLGQYDLGLAKDSDEMLLIVEPNIVLKEHLLGLKKEPFRFWILAHELTHKLQFKHFSWLKKHYFDLIDQLKKTLAVKEGVSQLGLLLNRQNWELIGKIQSFMSFIEGYADFVMFSVGKMLPGYRQLEPIFSRRQRVDAPVFKKIIEKIIGLDIKANQYRQGLSFVTQISQLKSLMFLNEQIDSPEKLPTLKELAEPIKWLRRIAR